VPVGPAFGTFGKNVETTVPVFGAIATGDMNRDGLADLGSNVESLYEIKRCSCRMTDARSSYMPYPKIDLRQKRADITVSIRRRGRCKAARLKLLLFDELW
jgi:hypothetical protein